VKYRLVITATAERMLSRLHERVAVAIVEFMLGSLTENPLRMSKPLSDEWAGCRSARRGSYRVIFSIDDEQVTVLRIGYRAHIYRR